MRMIVCYSCGKLILKKKAIKKHIRIIPPKEAIVYEPKLEGEILAEFDDYFCSEKCKEDYYYEFSKEELQTMYNKAVREGRVPLNNKE